jgi:glutamyl-tRNA reductase
VLSLAGLSHRTAPLELLERVSAAMERHQVPAAESIALRTCNRAELYVVGVPPAAVVPALGVSLGELREHGYVLEDLDAVRHLMRVASGLDSLIVGEVQILGQVAKALAAAQLAGTAGTISTRLFVAAVEAGRRTRRETEISRDTASMSHAAVRLALADGGDPATARVLLVGAGEAAGLAGRAFADAGAERLVWTGRTESRARALAERIGGDVLAWDRLGDGLRDADVVVTATSAPEPVIRVPDVAGVLPARGGRPLRIVDLAIPRDVEPAVGELPGVRRHDVADVRSVVDAGLARRRAAVPAAEGVILEEVDRFGRWLSAREVAPVIAGLREHVHDVVHNEAARGLDRVKRGAEDWDQAAARLARRITAQVLHTPILRLKAHAAGGRGRTHADALRDLFDLGGEHA